MPIQKIEFTELENQISKKKISYSNILAPQLGKAYAVVITRDGCSACEKQKPKFKELARSFERKSNGRVVFLQIHISRPANSDEESLRSKELLGHYFYPTNLVLLRTRDRGAFEYYRCVSPDIEELKKVISRAIEVAKFIDENIE